MISEVLEELNFDTFRRIPFTTARLEFSNGQYLVVEKSQDSDYPLLVKFDDMAAQLYKSRRDTKYTPEQQKKISKIREAALPLIRKVNFELLDIHRSLALRGGSKGSSR